MSEMPACVTVFIRKLLVVLFFKSVSLNEGGARTAISCNSST